MTAGRGGRHYSIILQRDGDLHARTWRIPRWAIRSALAVGGLLVLGGVLATAFYAPIARQAARVPFLTREVERLETDNRRVRELAAALDAGAQLIDIRPSMRYRAQHIAGAQWAIRPRFASLVLDPARPLVLLAEELAVAAWAAADLRARGARDVAVNLGTAAGWSACPKVSIRAPVSASVLRQPTSLGTSARRWKRSKIPLAVAPEQNHSVRGGGHQREIHTFVFVEIGGGHIAWPLSCCVRQGERCKRAVVVQIDLQLARRSTHHGKVEQIVVVEVAHSHSSDARAAGRQYRRSQERRERQIQIDVCGAFIMTTRRPNHHLVAAVADPVAVPSEAEHAPERVEHFLQARAALRQGKESRLRTSSVDYDRSAMAALLITGVPRSFVRASTMMRPSSFHIDVTMVSPGNTTPAKRAWYPATRSTAPSSMVSTTALQTMP